MNEVCKTCPRECLVNRKKAVGFCNEGSEIRIGKIVEHFMWEEPCITDQRGVFAVFFSGCNLRCDYCQNYAISRGGKGEVFSESDFCQLIENAQKTHEYIDLITPTHFAQPLCRAFEKIDKKAKIVWNTNGYESPETLEKVAKFVDIFLTDFKYSQTQTAQKFSKCADYFSKTLVATKKMCELKNDIFSGEKLCQGVIIRHLVLPDHVKNSFEVLDVLAQNFPERIVSVMSQFTPNGKSSLNRKITPLEYKAVLCHMQKLGLQNGYIQELESAQANFIPDFEG